MDAQSQQIEELKAQLERLRADIEALLLKHMRVENVYLNSLDAAIAEIEELKAHQPEVTPLKAQVFEITLRAFVEQNRAKNQIIRELCEWIDSEFRLDSWGKDSPGKQLWLRARAAIGDLIIPPQ